MRSPVFLVKMSLRDSKDIVSFEMVDRANRKLKVLGIRNEQTHEYDAASAPFVKDEIVELIEGPYPLTDYQDTSYHRAHTYIVEKSNGTQITGILHTFCASCTFAFLNSAGIPRLEILFPKAVTTASTNSSVNPQSES
jgi:molybdenum cofactor biosynthesis enzyme MoaA